jgi:hypothetical protein
MTKTPAQTLATSIKKPAMLPFSSVRAAAPVVEPADPVGAEFAPFKPVKMAFESVAEALSVAVVLVVVVSLARVGSWAPQGLSSRQELAHALSLHFSTH